MLTRCLGSHWLCWHGVSVVNDYADTHFLRISLQKQKLLQNHFCLFIWGPGRVFEKKVENLVILYLLREAAWNVAIYKKRYDNLYRLVNNFTKTITTYKKRNGNLQKSVNTVATYKERYNSYKGRYCMATYSMSKKILCQHRNSICFCFRIIAKFVYIGRFRKNTGKYYYNV